MEGVFVTPVPDAPLTAVAELQSTQLLADGSSETKKSVNHIARDSQGRIYNERREMVPESFAGTPPLVSFHIYDPTTKLNTFLDPYTHIAHQSVRMDVIPVAGIATSAGHDDRKSQPAGDAGTGPGHAFDGKRGGARGAKIPNHCGQRERDGKAGGGHRRILVFRRAAPEYAGEAR
jgi:hypothetical protein